jgi:methylated-DNA-[protein]-cysteine S-methyltransferase
MQRFTYATPWGMMVGTISDAGVRELLLPKPDAPASELAANEDSAVAAQLRAALDRYFAGEAESFDGIPLDMDGATEFTTNVWRKARGVPWGSTATYGALAARLGRDAGHARAVGHALGANPLHVLVPCHRFIAQDGGLVNFAAGLDWKRRLLLLEGSLLF